MQGRPYNILLSSIIFLIFQVRKVTCASDLCLFGIEYANAIEIGDDEWDDACFKNIRDEIGKNCYAINDLFSFKIELRKAGNLSMIADKNSVAFFIFYDEMSEIQAQQKVINLFENSQKNYYDLEKICLAQSGISEATKVFLEKGCRYFISGCAAAFSSCIRYSEMN